MPAPYLKPHASTGERVEHLRACGLLVGRTDDAARRIDLIGYERLRIYFRSRRRSDLPGRPFLPGISLDHILRLHRCDVELRQACFPAVGRFERLLRETMSEALSRRYGSHPYDRAAAFRNAASNLDANRILMTAYAQSKDRRAQHYRETYAWPPLPPIWIMKEFLTFGRTARLISCLDAASRREIADAFGVPNDEVFASWLACLVDLRNICAHHDRLFNRNFQKQPKTLLRFSIPTASPLKLIALLECLDHMLARRGAEAGIVAAVRGIVGRCEEVRPAEIGA